MPVWNKAKLQALAEHVDQAIKQYGFIVLIPGNTELSNLPEIRCSKVKELFSIIGDRVRYLDLIPHPDHPYRAGFIVGTHDKPVELWNFWSEFMIGGQISATEINDDAFLTAISTAKKQIKDGLESTFNLKLAVERHLH